MKTDEIIDPMEESGTENTAVPTSDFAATERMVYPTGDYPVLLTLYKKGFRVPFGTPQSVADSMKDSEKDPCFNFEFKMVNPNQAFINGEPNFIIDPRTAKPVTFGIQTGADAGSERSALRKLLQSMAGRVLTNSEVRRINAEYILKSKPLFTMAIMKTTNDKMEPVNKIGGITLMIRGKDTFKIDNCFNELDPLASQEEFNPLAEIA